MRKYVLLIVLCLILMCTVQVLAAEKPRIGVLRFTNHTSASWWGYTSGTELQDMLIAELASTKSFRVLERQELEKVLSEQKLSESGIVDESTRLKPGKIKIAKYLIAATVSSFQEDTTGSDAGVWRRVEPVRRHRNIGWQSGKAGKNPCRQSNTRLCN